MSNICIILAAILYLCTGIDLIFKQQYALSIMFICYSLSNVAIFFVSKGY